MNRHKAGKVYKQLVRIRKRDRGTEINITKAQKCSAFKEEGVSFQGHEQGNDIARITSW